MNDVTINDSREHIVLTTSQWSSRSYYNWIIPRGLLCVELAIEDGKNVTKIKIGEGDKYYRQLPYITADSSGGDLSDYYTKEEINGMIQQFEYFKLADTHIYQRKEDLPMHDNRNGDVRYVNSDMPDPFLFLWENDHWIQLSSSVTKEYLDQFAKKSEVNPRLTVLEQKAHTHPNKSVLDRLTQSVIDNSHSHNNLSILNQITAPYTVPEKEKLASLTNNNYIAGNGIILNTVNPTTQSINVKYGEGLSIDINGNLYVSGEYVPMKPDGTEDLFDSSYKINSRYLPSYVDDIVEGYYNPADYKFYKYRSGSPGSYIYTDEIPGEESKIYVDLSVEPAAPYRWADGIGFISMSSPAIPDYTGATESAAGIHGLVPAAEAGENTDYYLRGDATWSNDPIIEADTLTINIV